MRERGGFACYGINKYSQTNEEQEYEHKADYQTPLQLVAIAQVANVEYP